MKIDALVTTNRQHANVAATVEECVVVEEEVLLQESMLQQHFSRYDYYSEEIPHPPQNPESNLCSCFVVAQLEQRMAANLQHHNEEVSVENEMASQET